MIPSLAIFLLSALCAFGQAFTFADLAFMGRIGTICGNPEPTYPYAYMWKNACTNFSVTDPSGVYDGSSSNAGFTEFSAINCSNLTAIGMAQGSLTNVWLEGCTNMTTGYDFRLNNIFCHTALATNFGRIFREITTNTLNYFTNGGIGTPDALFQGNGYFDFDGLAAIQHYNNLGLGSGTIQCDGVSWEPTNSTPKLKVSGGTDNGEWDLQTYLDSHYPGVAGSQGTDYTQAEASDGMTKVFMASATNLLTFIRTNCATGGDLTLPSTLKMLIFTNNPGGGDFDFTSAAPTNVNFLESAVGDVYFSFMSLSAVLYFNGNNCGMSGGDGGKIDDILAALVAAGLSNGYVNLRLNNDGGAGTQGLLDCDTLALTRGWTVLCDNYP
jgi:hypothetical protein